MRWECGESHQTFAYWKDKNSRKQKAHADGDYCKGFVGKSSLTRVHGMGSISLHRWKSLGDGARFSVVCVHIAGEDLNKRARLARGA